MPIRFACPNCKKTLNAPDYKAGLRVACSGCKQPLLVPTPSTTKTADTTRARAPNGTQGPGPRSASKRLPPTKAKNPEGDPARVEKVEARPAVDMPLGGAGRWKSLPMPTKFGIIGGGIVLLVILVAVPVLLFVLSGRTSTGGTLAGQTPGKGVSVEPKRGWKLLRSNENRGWITGPSFSPDDQTIAVGGAAVKLFDAGLLEERAILEPAGSSRMAVFSPRGNLVAWGDKKEFGVRAYDLTKKEIIASLPAHQNDIRGRLVSYPVFSPDGRRLVSVSEATSTLKSGLHVHVYDAQTWKQEAVLAGAHPVAFTADGSRLGVNAVKNGKKDQAIIFYDMDRLKEEKRLAFNMKEDGLLGDWTLSPDGQTLALSLQRDKDVHVTLWDVVANKRQKVLHTVSNDRMLTARRIGGLVFSPDGRKLAAVERLTRSEQGQIKVHDSIIWVWDVASGEAATLANEYPAWLSSISFSKNGDKIVSTRLVQDDDRRGTASESMCLFAEAQEAGVFAYLRPNNENPFAGQEKDACLPEFLIFPDGAKKKSRDAGVDEKAFVLLKSGMSKEEVKDLLGRSDDDKTDEKGNEFWAYRKRLTTIIGFGSRGGYEGKVASLHIDQRLMFAGDQDYRSRGGVRP